MSSRAASARKSKGKPVVSTAPEETDDKVVDLMEALRRSLKGGGGPSRDKADRFIAARSEAGKAKKKTATKKRAA